MSGERQRFGRCGIMMSRSVPLPGRRFGKAKSAESGPALPRRIGVITSGVNPTYKPGEVKHQLKICGVDGILYLDSLYETMLEPIMNLSVFVDDQYLGDVLSDLSSRRGKVQGQEAIGGGIDWPQAHIRLQFASA